MKPPHCPDVSEPSLFDLVPLSCSGCDWVGSEQRKIYGSSFLHVPTTSGQRVVFLEEGESSLLPTPGLPGSLDPLQSELIVLRRAQSALCFGGCGKVEDFIGHLPLSTLSKLVNCTSQPLDVLKTSVQLYTNSNNNGLPDASTLRVPSNSSVLFTPHLPSVGDPKGRAMWPELKIQRPYEYLPTRTTRK